MKVPVLLSNHTFKKHDFRMPEVPGYYEYLCKSYQKIGNEDGCSSWFVNFSTHQSSEDILNSLNPLSTMRCELLGAVPARKVFDVIAVLARIY